MDSTLFSEAEDFPAFAETHYDFLASFDGAFEPRGTKRAHGSWGFVIHDASGREIERESALVPKADCDSNNVAEYLALLKALDWATANVPGRAVLFQGDSQLVVHHCRRVWGWNERKTLWRPHPKNPLLRAHLLDAIALLEKFPRLSTTTLEPGSDPKANNLPIIWVRGESNQADDESRKPLREAGLWN